MVKLRKLEKSEILEYNQKVSSSDSASPFEYINLWAGECMSCGNQKVPSINFVLEFSGELEDVDFDEVEKLLIEETGLEDCGLKETDLGHIVNVSSCPRCGSEDIFEDF